MNDKISTLLSTQVIFIGENAGYVPLPPVRDRELPSAPEEVDWKLPVDNWDREYRKFRHNTTRVQRK